MVAKNLDVFLNCPFDKEYADLFQAIVFTVTACGYRLRCALEENDGGDVRLEKLCKLIGQSSRSIHDLSRVAVNEAGLPRFNMPFELGLVIGAKKFGSKQHRLKSALIMTKEQFKLPAYMSDLGGNDPLAHKDEADEVIKIVRNYLKTRADEDIPLPGAKLIQTEFHSFLVTLPGIAEDMGMQEDEVDPIKNYSDFAYLVAAYLKEKPVV